jgi:hypothetical protein
VKKQKDGENGINLDTDASCLSLRKNGRTSVLLTHFQLGNIIQKELIMNKKIEKTFETWHCNDERLPETKELAGPPPAESMLETLQYIQEQPIGIVKHGKNYIFIWGRRRLKAIRQLFEENKHDGSIDILVITGIDPNDYGKLAIIENQQRSPNEISAWETIRAMLYAKPVDNVAPTYKTISDYLQMSIGEIKALERKWGKVPVWASNAVVKGIVAPTTAILIGKLDKSLQDECKETLRTEKKLSFANVKEKKQFVQIASYAQMMPQLQIAVQRDYYSREELQQLADLIPNTAVEAQKYAQELLNS